MKIDPQTKQTGSFLATLTVVVCLFGTVAVSDGQNNLSGCVDGNCSPRTLTYGHYQPMWRRWPGATTYEGYLKPSGTTAVPEPTIPDALNESRTLPRTRSEEPLDGNEATKFMPDASNEANPFNATVDESDIPQQGGFGQTGMGVPNANGTAPLGGADDLMAPPPSDNDLFSPLPSNDAPPAPGGFANPPSQESAPDAEFDFGLPALDDQSNNSAIRAIKNRRLDLNLKTTKMTMVPTIEQQTHVEIAPYEAVGGEFSVSDLIDDEPHRVRQSPMLKVDIGDAIKVKTVSFEQAVSNPNEERLLLERALETPVLLDSAHDKWNDEENPRPTLVETESEDVSLKKLAAKPARKRGMLASHRQSLRETLRKNPLR